MKKDDATQRIQNKLLGVLNGNRPDGKAVAPIFAGVTKATKDKRRAANRIAKKSRKANR